jgi:hypothetical protein
MHLKRIEGRYYAYESARRDGRYTSRCWGRMPDLCVPTCREVARDCREMREIEKVEAGRDRARTLAPLVALRDEVFAYGGRSTRRSRRPSGRSGITAAGAGRGGRGGESTWATR